MKLTRDVVKDLLTVYLAGDASTDTRSVVEEWLRTDPDLARQAEEARRGDLPPVSLPEPSSEKQVLNRTRRQLRKRALVLGVAIYVSTLPFTIVFSSAGFRGLLIEDWLERGVLAILAAVLWGVYFTMSRRLRTSGL